MKSLSGKVAIVTGAGRGIGFGIASVLAEKGADVIITDINEETAKEAVAKLSEYGTKIDYCIGDVSKKDDADAVIKKAIDEFSGLHIVVNNAGINKDGMMHKMSDSNWQSVIDVNLTGVFNISRAALLHMREQSYGRIINIASAGWEGNIGQANYAAAKAGVIGLSKTIAKENAKKGITCNAICPGFIDTAMTRGIPAEYWEAAVSKIPMGYAGKPEDVGYMIAFLASDEASYITAEVINVGGGYRLA